jgi:hypothetical protein
MKWHRLLSLAAALPVLAAFASHVLADAGLQLGAPSLFNYIAPKGWTSQVGPSAFGGFPQAVGPAAHNFTPDITFKTNGYASVATFVKSYRPTLIDTDQPFPLKLVDQKPFATASGAKGVRLHSIDPSNPPTAEQFSYIFANPDGMIFDASMKTVVIVNFKG